MSVGLTLTASSNVVFVELPWTMADLSQCECRAYRNGQKNQRHERIDAAEAEPDDQLL